MNLFAQSAWFGLVLCVSCANLLQKTDGLISYMLKFHHHYIASWFHLWNSWTLRSSVSSLEENTPSFGSISELGQVPHKAGMYLKTTQKFSWVTSTDFPNTETSSESISATSEFAVAHSKTTPRQTLEEFRKDHELRDVSVSQAQRNLPELWKLTLLLPPPSPAEGLWNLYSDHVVYLLKALQIFPQKHPRRLWPEPPSSASHPFPSILLQVPTPLAHVSFITSQIVTGSLYVMSALCVGNFVLFVH